MKKKHKYTKRKNNKKLSKKRFSKKRISKKRNSNKKKRQRGGAQSVNEIQVNSLPSDYNFKQPQIISSNYSGTNYVKNQDTSIQRFGSAPEPGRGLAGGPDPEQVKQLVDMGFNEEQVRVTLAKIIDASRVGGPPEGVPPAPGTEYYSKHLPDLVQGLVNTSGLSRDVVLLALVEMNGDEDRTREYLKTITDHIASLPADV